MYISFEDEFSQKCGYKKSCARHCAIEMIGPEGKPRKRCSFIKCCTPIHT